MWLLISLIFFCLHFVCAKNRYEKNLNFRIDFNCVGTLSRSLKIPKSDFDHQEWSVRKRKFQFYLFVIYFHNLYYSYYSVVKGEHWNNFSLQHVSCVLWGVFIYGREHKHFIKELSMMYKLHIYLTIHSVMKWNQSLNWSSSTAIIEINHTFSSPFSAFAICEFYFLRKFFFSIF